MTSTLKLKLSTFAAFIAVLALSSTAVAAPQDAGYRTLGGQTQAEVQGGDTGGGAAGGDTGGEAAGADAGNAAVTASVANDEGSGSLPFTGLDVAFLALAGGLLAAAGLGMRRLVRSTDVA